MSDYINSNKTNQIISENKEDKQAIKLLLAAQHLNGQHSINRKTLTFTRNISKKHKYNQNLDRYSKSKCLLS